MNIQRQYKLWKLKVPIDSKFEAIFKTFEYEISNLQKFEITKFPNMLFFINFKGLNVLQIKDNKRLFIASPATFLEVVGKKYFDDYDTSVLLPNVIKDMVEEKNNIKIENFELFPHINDFIVENAYKDNKIKLENAQYTHNW